MRQMTEAAVRDSAGMSRTFFYYINVIFEKKKKLMQRSLSCTLFDETLIFVINLLT